MAQKLSNLPVGAIIKFGKHQIGSETAQSIIWVVADKNHSGYPSNSVTLIARNIIDVRAYDAAETGNAYGNSNYVLSNINQWLNSSASAGQWYSATHSADVAPDYKSRPGFLYNFTEYERLAILPTTIQATADASSKITAKIFLPSEGELIGSGTLSDNSSRLAYFNSSVAMATFSTQAFSYAAKKPDLITDYYAYWTRTTNSDGVLCLLEKGSTRGQSASTQWFGVRPVLNLSATAKISDSTDSDGCYTTIVNNSPTISGSNTNLGTITTTGFTHTYSVGDSDTSDAVTVTEYIDNVSVRSYVATKNATNTFNVTGNTWFRLTNGTHTLQITATDGFDTATRTITFIKSVSKLVVQRSTPMTASTRPNQIVVSVVKTIPYNALLTVEVTNNGFDALPIWDKLDTSSISSGLAHTFSNGKDGSTPVCTAGKWGVNIRVTVDRNGGEGACYISEIGGNFE